MSERRTVIAIVLFVINLLVCAIWAYREASAMLEMLSGTGSAGTGSVMVGVLPTLYTIAPPIITIWLARASGSMRLAKYWRNAHLAVLLAMAILPLMGGLRVMMVSIVVFLPVQVFFVVGALALWIASTPRRPDTPSEATS